MHADITGVVCTRMVCTHGMETVAASPPQLSEPPPMTTPVPGGIEGDGPFANDYKLYMLCNQRPGVPTRTRLGCTRDVARRFADHNSVVPRAGSDRRARQAAGWWREVLRIIVPADRDLDARSLLNHWRQRSRKIHRRFTFGIDMAERLRLVYFVNAETLASDALLSRELPQDVARTQQRVEQTSPERASRVRRAVQRSFASMSRSPLPAVFDGLSFTKTDGRERRKRARSDARRQQIKRQRVVAAAAAAAATLSTTITSSSPRAHGARSRNSKLQLSPYADDDDDDDDDDEWYDDTDDDDDDDNREQPLSMSDVGMTLRDALRH